MPRFCFFTWLFFFDENSVISHQKNKQRLKELIQHRDYFKKQIASDKQKLEDLKSGKENLEKFAREQYYMSKPDEDVFVVVEEEQLKFYSTYFTNLWLFEW